MFTLIKQLLGKQNEFASGGLLLMIVGALGVSLRSIPEYLWECLVHQTTMKITVVDEDTAFEWVKEWFLEQPFLRRIRQLDIDTTLRGQRVALLPAPGRHFFWHAGRPYWVWFYRGDEKKGRYSGRPESFTLRTIGRDQPALKKFVEEIVVCHRRRSEVTSHLYMYDGGWERVQAYAPRSLESIILNPGEMEHLKTDVATFLASRHRYRLLGVPYHRGYLLYGPPGTGKTSLVSGVAAHFGMSIYALNLTEFDDRSLKNAVNQIPQHSIVLFEDIDCMGTADARKLTSDATRKLHAPEDAASSAQFGVTLSGLLNVLDGLSAPESVLFAMTTNRMEVLDDALLRPGRIDYKLLLGKAEDTQKIGLYRRFFPDNSLLQAKEFVRRQSFAETMAEFQGLLLSMDEDMEEMELATADVKTAVTFQRF